MPDTISDVLFKAKCYSLTLRASLDSIVLNLDMNLPVLQVHVITYCSCVCLMRVGMYIPSKNSLKNTQWVIRSLESKNRQYVSRPRWHMMIYKSQHSKLKVEQHEPHWKPGLNCGASEWWTVPAPLVAVVVVSPVYKIKVFRQKPGQSQSYPVYKIKVWPKFLSQDTFCW